MPACLPNLMADINHLERIQRLATMLVTGIPHLPYEVRLHLLGLHSLQWRWLRVDLVIAFKVFTRLLDIDAKLSFFSLPLDAALEVLLLRVTPRYEPPPEVGESLNIILSPSSPLTEISSPLFSLLQLHAAH